MRRIFKTTTAIVAIISILSPQLAVAQSEAELLKRRAEERQQQQQQKQQQQRQQQQRQQQQRQQREQAAPQNRQERQPQRAQPAERAQQERAPERAQQQRAQPADRAQQQRPRAEQQPQRAQGQPAREGQPPRKQPAPQPERQAQPPKPQQRERQQEQRARQQAEPRQQQPARDAQPRRAGDDAPAPRAAQGQRDDARPSREQPRPDPRRPADQAAPQRETRPEQPGVRPAPNRAEAPQNRPAAPQRGEGRENPPPRAANRDGQQAPGVREQRPAPMDANALRNVMEQREREGQQPAPRPARNQQALDPRRPSDTEAPERPRTREELQRQLQRSNGEIRLRAPEADVKPNDLARRAAERSAPPKAAALAAAAERQSQENVIKRRITEQNIRRSDQDFGTRIRDGLRPGDRRNLSPAELRDLERRERQLREDERRLDERERDLARRDDDDDNGSDIAKLLLAGAAGFAVGKMLSGNRQVALNTGDRAVLTLPDGSQQIVRDDNALLYRPGSDVQTEQFADGSTRTTVLRADGSRVVTIRDADMNILRRTLIHPNGTETRLISNTEVRPVQISTLPAPVPVEYTTRPLNETELRNALLQESAADRRFTLGQIRDIPEVRSLVAPVNLPQVTFDSGSAALAASQAEQLASLGKVIRDSIDQNPNEVYMIEGYTDAVGSSAENLALSDRRAESVALALTEYYQVPPENMVVQGYGEQFLLVPTDGAERENRRVAVRRITDLLEQQ